MAADVVWAVIVTDAPKHIGPLLETVTVGFGLTLVTILVVAVQPLVSVAVTAHVPAVLTVILLPVAPFDHE